MRAAERSAPEACGIELIEGTVARFLIGQDRLEAVELSDGRAVERAAVFVRPALHGRGSGLLESLGCKLAPGGFAAVDLDGKTSVAGVRAVGNAANPVRRVVTAAGQGSAAAIAINADLVADDVRNAAGA